MIKKRTTHKSQLPNPQQLAQGKKQPQKVSNIYSMLNRQQQVIESLLAKYSDGSPALNAKKNKDSYDNYDDGLHQAYIKPRSQTIDYSMKDSSIRLKLLLSKDQKTITRQSSPNSRTRQNSQLYALPERDRMMSGRSKNQSISLPIVHQRGKLSKSRSTKKKLREKQQSGYLFIRDRAKMQNQLYKIYGEKNTYFANQVKWQAKKSLSNSQSKKTKNKSKMLTKLKGIQRAGSFGQQIKASQQQQGAGQHLRKSQAANRQPEIESDDDSEQQQIPTMYYERQFRDKLRAQCLQQLNFLYFTKNEVMRDWTDNLLALLEKHDKDITAMRIKSKYLHTFDDKFFSIGIFNTDDL